MRGAEDAALGRGRNMDGRRVWGQARTALVTVGALVGAALTPMAAQAAVTNAPARTWGIGPASTTTASVGVPRVLAIQPIGDRIFVAGTFSSIIDPSGVSYPAKNIAVFSATTGAADLRFLGGTNNTITSLATDGGSTLYLGGTFGTVNGATRKGLAALDARTGALLGWNPAVAAPGQVDAVAYAAGSVYAGGNFSAVTGSSGTSQAFVAKLDASTAAVDTGWTPTPDGRVRALNVAAGGSARLFLGGDFTSVSSKASTNKVAAVALGGTGAVDTSFKAAGTNQGAYAPVYDLTSDGSRVYTGSAGSGGACAALSVTSGALVWSDHSNGNMQSVRLMGGQLFCAGHFSGSGSFLGQTRYKLAAVDPATGALSSFAPQINSSQGPWALAADTNHLYMGGDFNTVARVAQPHFAMFLDSSVVAPSQPPTGLVASPGNGAVQLSWSVPSSDGGSALMKYKVFRSTTKGGEDLTKSPLATLSNSTRSFSDTSVVNGMTYYYVVVATNAVGTSAASTEASAQPGGSITATVPGAPTSVQATNPPGYNHLQWNPPTSDGGSPITSYQVFRGTTPGGEDLSKPVATVATTSYDDQLSVVAGATYYYKLKAVNQVGPGPASAEVSATLTPGAPGAPTLSGKVVSGPAVQLTWTVPSDGGSPITKYVVLRDTVRLTSLTASATGPTGYADTAPPSGTHVYQVKAVNAYGNGQLSNKVSVSVP